MDDYSSIWISDIFVPPVLSVIGGKEEPLLYDFLHVTFWVWTSNIFADRRRSCLALVIPILASFTYHDSIMTYHIPHKQVVAFIDNEWFY